MAEGHIRDKHILKAGLFALDMFMDAVCMSTIFGKGVIHYNNREATENGEDVK